MSARDQILSHLQTGTTTLCRLWHLVRKDGMTLGFTDHDRDLVVEGVTFRASSGLSAAAIERSSGLAVDNTEGLGALMSDSLSEEDIQAGRLDGAEVTIWLANWQAPSERLVLFRGHVGEIARADGAFRAELRGLAEALNQPLGRVFQPSCSARLGDGACGIDLQSPSWSAVFTIAALTPDGGIVTTEAGAFDDGFFSHGALLGIGARIGGVGSVLRSDRLEAGARRIDLWYPTGLALAVGDQVRLTAGCDRSATTCRTKFSNFLNFRGFPHIPGEDWLAAVPSSKAINDGGSMNT